MKQKNWIGSASWGFRELPLEAQLELAARLGMTFHELGIANGDNDLQLEGGNLPEIKKLYEDRGISLLCAATGCDFTGEDYRKQLEKIRHVTELCRQLGVRKLRVFAGFMPLQEMDPQKWQQVISCLRLAAEEGKQQGVELCVETHGAVEPFLDGVRHIPSATTQPEDLGRLLAETEVSVVFDPANIRVVGQSPEAVLDKIAYRLGYVHLKDFRAGDGGQLYPCAMGDGDTPWETLAPRLKQAAVPLLLEYENPWDLEEGLVKSLSFWNEVSK